MLINNSKTKTVSVSDWQDYAVQQAGIHPDVEDAMYQEALRRGENPLRLGEASFTSTEVLEIGDVIEQGMFRWKVTVANHPNYRATRFFAE